MKGQGEGNDNRPAAECDETTAEEEDDDGNDDGVGPPPPVDTSAKTHPHVSSFLYTNGLFVYILVYIMELCMC